MQKRRDLLKIPSVEQPKPISTVLHCSSLPPAWKVRHSTLKTLLRSVLPTLLPHLSKFSSFLKTGGSSLGQEVLAVIWDSFTKSASDILRLLTWLLPQVWHCLLLPNTNAQLHSDCSICKYLLT